MITVVSTQSPALYRDLAGRLAVVGGTILSINGIPVAKAKPVWVPEGTTLDDIQWKSAQPQSAKPSAVELPTIVQVAGSNGKQYQVTVVRGGP